MIAFIDYNRENGKIISVFLENINDKYTKVEYNLKSLSDFYNFKYVNGKLVKLTNEEKNVLYPSSSLEPNEQDVINATLMKEIASLKVGGFNE